ncbi:MAG: hypothetical protein L0387_29465 [Acidobacteria bacterium]|nr:hypothetical protein [Acidobacteriota bacterium]
MNRFLFPWGRLYFVFDGSLYDNPFRKPESDLVSYISDRIAGVEGSQTTTSGHEHRGLPLRTLWWAGFAGIVVSLMATLLLPSEVAQFHPRGPEWPRWLVFYDQAKNALFSWPWNLLVFALFVLAATKSDRRRAWAFAFVAGLLLPTVLGLR